MSTARIRALVVTVFMTVALVTAASGCFRRMPESAGEPQWLLQPRPREYLLDIGDVLDIKLFYHPELNETGLVVRTDGKITAQLVGDVTAHGQTPTQLAAILVEAYRREGLLQPSVAILLRKSAGLRVFVTGEVANPGMIAHEGLLTLSQAIAQAGGSKATAEVRSIALLRDAGKQDREPLFAVINLKDRLAAGQDVPLQPYDVIVVPKSRIAELNQIVEQYIVKLIPVTFSAGFSYTLGVVKTPFQ
jgi:polysaccharide export outer membrane protein